MCFSEWMTTHCADLLPLCDVSVTFYTDIRLCRLLPGFILGQLSVAWDHFPHCRFAQLWQNVSLLGWNTFSIMQPNMFAQNTAQQWQQWVTMARDTENLGTITWLCILLLWWVYLGEVAYSTLKCFCQPSYIDFKFNKSHVTCQHSQASKSSNVCAPNHKVN